MATILPALAFCVLSLSTSERLPIDIVFQGPPLPPRLQATAMREASLIWAPYGVDVRASYGHDGGRDGAIRLNVVIADRVHQHNEIYTLGSILFVEGAPSTRIVMYPDAIATLVSADALVERGGSRSSPLVREQLLGRVLGRALAHEIGHYLLRSSGHSRTGLMRASPPTIDLVDPRPSRGFDLSAEEVTHLHELPAWRCQGN